jgi:Uma2 family endonuclease
MLRQSASDPRFTYGDHRCPPDIAVICDPAKLDSAGCRGAPVWILEVLSPAATARDRVQKRDWSLDFSS